MAKNVGHLEATLGINTLGLTRGLASARASMLRAGASMKRIGRSMSMSLTLPLLVIGGGAIKMAIDFEKSMSKIEGLVGIAADKVKAFSKDIMNLSGETAKAPLELADAMFFITSAGLRGADALDVLKQSARASTAGLGDTKVIADLVTSAVNAYGIANLSAAAATDTLVATVREGKAEAAELVASMGQVLPIASALSVSFDQVGASIAAMTRTGTSATTAAIQLRQILASLLKPSGQAEELLKELGISGDGTAAAFRGLGTSSATLRKQLASEGLLAVFKTIREAVENNSDAAEAYTVALGGIFPNVRALSGVLDLTGKNLAENEELFKRMTNVVGDADNAFDAAAKTVNFEFNQALAELKVEAIALGETLMPVFKSIIEAVRNGIRWFKSLSSASKRMGLMFAGIALAIGPLVFILGAMITILSSVLVPIGLVIAGISLLSIKTETIAEKVTNLVARLRSLNITEEKRLELISELNAIAPEIAKTLDEEGRATTRTVTALRFLNREYARKLVLETKNEEIKKIQLIEGRKLLNVSNREFKIEQLLNNIRDKGTQSQQIQIELARQAGISTEDLVNSLIRLADESDESVNSLSIHVEWLKAEKRALKEAETATDDLVKSMGIAVDRISGFSSTTITTPSIEDEGGKGGKPGGGGGGGPIVFIGLLEKSILSLQTPWRAFKQAMADGVANPFENFKGHEVARPFEGFIEKIKKLQDMDTSNWAAWQFTLAEIWVNIAEGASISFKQLLSVLDEALNFMRSVTDLMAAVFVSLGESIGNALAGVDNQFSTPLQRILLILANFAKSLGAMLIGIGTIMLTTGIFSGPGAGLLAAGLALVIIGSTAAGLINKKINALQGLRSGGFVTEGGAFQLHKDEIVTLPSGSAVTSQSNSRIGGAQELFAVIRGEDIFLVTEEYKRKHGNSG